MRDATFLPAREDIKKVNRNDPRWDDPAHGFGGRSMAELDEEYSWEELNEMVQKWSMHAGMFAPAQKYFPGVKGSDWHAIGGRPDAPEVPWPPVRETVTGVMLEDGSSMWRLSARRDGLQKNRGALAGTRPVRVEISRDGAMIDTVTVPAGEVGVWWRHPGAIRSWPSASSIPRAEVSADSWPHPRWFPTSQTAHFGVSLRWDASRLSKVKYTVSEIPYPKYHDGDYTPPTADLTPPRNRRHAGLPEGHARRG